MGRGFDIQFSDGMAPVFRIREDIPRKSSKKVPVMKMMVAMIIMMVILMIMMTKMTKKTYKYHDF